MKYSESVRAIKAFEKKYGIRFNLNMSGKMADIKCLSTSNLCNPFCACRNNSPALICNKCFADSTCSRYAALRTNMERNTDILTSVMIPVEEWPLLNSVEDPIFRFESFGDLVNEIQAQNYMNMARRNPKTRFALWTKNPGSFRLFLCAKATRHREAFLLLPVHSRPLLAVLALSFAPQYAALSSEN